MSPAAQQIRNITTGDYFFLVSLWLFFAALGFFGAATCYLEIFTLLWNECRGRGHARSLLFKLAFYRAFTVLLFFALLIGGALTVVGAGLNSRAYVASYVDCENATEITQGIDTGYYAGCIAANISFPGSVSGFWDIWVQDKRRVAWSLFTW